MKRLLTIANGIFAAAFMLAPAVIFAAPPPSHLAAGNVVGIADNSAAVPVDTSFTTPGDNNAGTIKLHPIGPCPDKNAEQLNHGAPNCDPNGYEPSDEASQNAEIGKVEDVTMRHVPHLPCENIEVLGSGMADESGNYSIDSWPPSGHKEPVYGKDSAGNSVLTAGMSPGDVGNNGSSVYNHALGGLQVMDIIDVDALINNAIAAGAKAHHVQGYHFKVQFNQGTDQPGNSHKEQKHKTFWVNCPAGGPTPEPTGTPTPTPTGTPTPTPTGTPTPEPTATPTPEPTDTPSPEPTGTPTPAPTGTPTPAPTGTPTPGMGSVAGVTYLCSNGHQTTTPAAGTITIGGMSGASPQTLGHLTPGATQDVSALAGNGFELVACGGPGVVTPPCAVTGNMSGHGTATVPSGGTATVCFYEQPIAPGTITAVIYREGTTQVVPGGTVQLQGVTQPTGSYKATYPNLPPGQYCVQEATPAGFSLTSTNLPMTGTPGQVCTSLASGQTVDVIYYVSQPPAPTACVGEQFMLQGTQIVVPGGTVGLTGQPETTAPHTYCNLPVGSVTGTPVAVPAGYVAVPGTGPVTTVLHAGNNPTIIYYVTLPASQPQCGEVLGTIVLAGTSTMVPGGTITQAGQPAVTTYPSLLGPCVEAGTVPVTATAPAGYTFVGPSSTVATIIAGQVTPVTFQVAPLAGNVAGVHTTPPQAAQHAPASGVLGASTGMPVTGNEALRRILLSLVCLTIGMGLLAMNARSRRQA